MSRCAVLCGFAPIGFQQKKITYIHDVLISEQGGSWAEKEILVFPNSVTEPMLMHVLKNLFAQGTDIVSLFIVFAESNSEEKINFIQLKNKFPENFIKLFFEHDIEFQTYDEAEGEDAVFFAAGEEVHI